MPTYNEEPARVMSRVQAIYDRIAQARAGLFDIFILSDTTDPNIFVAEEVAYLALRERLQAKNIYYRHSRKTTPRRPATSPNGCAVSAALTNR